MSPAGSARAAVVGHRGRAMATIRPSRRRSLRLPLLRGAARPFGVAAGIAVAAGGIAATLQAGLGVGPYDVLNSGVSQQAGITFGTANVLASVVACLVGWRLGAKVGPGTIAATLLIGPAIDAWRWALPQPSSPGLQVLAFLVGLVLLSYGLSLIIAAGLGPGAVEVLMMGIVVRGVPLRWARTALEVSMCLAGIALGGQFGVGTLVIAFGIGHLMALFVPREMTRPAARR